MTFQPNIPLATDLISSSQDDIKQNFQALNTSWDVNHVGFNSVGAGKHNFVEMPNQTTPGPAGAAGQFVIYSLDDSGQSELWYRRNNEATEYQLTGKNPSITTAGNTFGYTFLPGGLLIQWKICSTNDTGAFGKNDGAAITFPIAFSSSPYSIQLTAERNGTTTLGLYFLNPTASGFTLKVSTNANISIHVAAIGPA